MRTFQFLLIGTLLTYPVSVTASTLVVPDNYPAVQHAIDAARPGDTVQVKAGVYEESLTFKDGIKLIGEGRDKVTIRIDAKEGPVLSVTDCSNGTISGLTLEHAGVEDLKVEGEDRPQVMELKRSSVELTNCTIQGSARSGILMKGECSPSVRQCIVRQNAWNGIIALGTGCTPRLENNECLENKGMGIGIAEGACGTVEGNGCIGNGNMGIVVADEGSAPTLRGNRCSENESSGIYIWKAAGGIVESNICTENEWHGMVVVGKGSAPVLKSNRCSKNGINGIYLGEGARGSAEENICTLNERNGIVAIDSGTAAKLTKNDCSENKDNGIYFGDGARGSAEGNTCTGNVWHGISVAGRDTAVTLRKNRCSENRGSGIYFGDGTRVIANGNISTGNGEISKGEIGRLLESEQFDRLEAIVSRLRSEKRRYRSGEWQLGFFYEYVRDASEKAGVSRRDRHLEVLERWAKAYPQSATPRIALAKAYVNYAWAARGGGWASSVDEAGWKGFRENLVKAWDTLAEARRLSTKDPTLYSELMTIGMGLSIAESEMEAIFREGVALEPTYYPIYYNRVISLLPRWGGAPRETETFAARAAESTRDQEGEALYARIAAYVLHYVGISAFHRDFEFSWPRVKQGHLEILERFPESNYRFNWFCLLATLFKDKETARGLFDRIGGDWDGDVWPTEQHFARCRSWARDDGPWPEPQALHYAAERGNVWATGQLLNRGDDINARDEFGRTALHVATGDEDVKLIRFLLQNGADVNIAADNNRTPLYIAVEANNAELVELFLQHGAEINVATYNGWSPLMRACQDGNVELVRMLLRYEPNVNQKMNGGWGALHLAAREGLSGIVEMLLDVAGVDLDIANDQQSTPLHQAAERGHDEVVKLLLDKGAEVNVRNEEERTPLTVALRHRRQSTAELLRMHGGVE